MAQYPIDKTDEYESRHVPRQIEVPEEVMAPVSTWMKKEGIDIPTKTATFTLSDKAAETIKNNPAYANDPDYAEMLKKKAFADKYMHPSGATSSHVARRYDLIPREGLDVLADRYGEGAKLHGDRNYLSGLADKQFILDRINHIQEHYTKMLNMRSSDKEYKEVYENSIDVANAIKEHLGAIMWGVCFLAQVLEHPEGSRILINEIIHFKR